jgi:D-glycero-D-manno-heptose 1,7-bisphosphate phosphatase
MKVLDTTGIRPMALLDRDGVVNVDVGFPHRPEQIIWVKGAFEALARLRQAGYRVVVVTNQSGVARGYYTEADVQSLHAWMGETIARHGGEIDAFFYCPYHPEAVVPKYREEHFDRKPSPGMVLRALDSFATDRERSFLIGDRQSDLDAARAAGITGALFTGDDLAAFLSKFMEDRGESLSKTRSDGQ